MSQHAADWLASLQLDGLISLFEEQEIDLEAVQDLTENDLRELGIPMGPRKKLLRAIAELESFKSQQDSVQTKPAPTASPLTMESQSRQVTVMFADISGFTSLSAQIGAEETRTLLQFYFEAAEEIVRMHGGFVEKHIGDSVMAVFGVPVAFGNEAERALSAAWAIQKAMPAIGDNVDLPLDVHIGLASGKVVAKKAGSDESFAVIGTSVNLAARLTDKAKAGEIIVSENVHSALPMTVEIGESHIWALKGFEEPVVAYLIKPDTKLDTVQKDITPLIGRSKEVTQFRLSLDECLQAERGQFVCLRGEAGIGKTRLAREFMDMAVRDGLESHRVLVLDFGAALGQDAPRALTRSLLGLNADSDDEACRHAAKRVLETGMIIEDDLMHLHHLLGLPQPDSLRSLHDAMSAEMRRCGQRDALVAIICKSAKLHPVFILVEDIHWADQSTLETIAEITRRISKVPVILVATTRIEGDPLQILYRSGLGLTALMTLDLRSLLRAEALQIASGFPDASLDLIGLCVDRSEGNPLFLEQLLRNAASTGFDAVPDTVQSLVQASLDTLDGVDREALEAAAVMGQRFRIEDVRRVVNSPTYDPLELVAHHLVTSDGDRFLFAHALVRDGVYASVLPSRRRDLHAKTAAALGADNPPLRARHLELAQDSGAAAAYLEAAKFAAMALEDDTVLDLSKSGAKLSPSPRIYMELMRLQGDALRNLGRTEDSIAIFRDVEQAAKQQDDKCLSLIGIAEGLRIASRYEEALETLDLAEVHAENMPARVRARMFHLRGGVYFPLGNIKQCLGAQNASLKFARESGDPESEASSLSGLGDAYYLQGLMLDARKSFDDCLAICRENALVRIEVANRYMVGWSRMYMLEFREALEDGIACAHMAARVGHRRAEVQSKQLIGHTGFKLGEYDLAETSSKEALEISEAIGSTVFSIFLLSQLAGLCRERGEIAKAIAYIEDAMERLKQTGRSFCGPFVYAVAASLETDPIRRTELITKGEQILDEGCVSHNYAWFTDVAVNIELQYGNYDNIERHAARLQYYTRSQPLAWGNFIVERARALSAVAQGAGDDTLPERLRALAQTANRAGLTADAHALEGVVRQT